MTRRKRFTSLLAALLAVTALMTTLPSALAASTTWYSRAQAYCEEHGLIGTIPETVFSASTPITRAQIADIFYRWAKAPELPESVDTPFKDVDSGSWYAGSVWWAWQNGVMAGYSPTSFGPNDMVTREQFATILWKYAGSPVANMEHGIVFPDWKKIASWASPAVDWMSTTKMVAGRDDGTFDPKGTATQAEAVVILYQYFQFMDGAQDDGSHLVTPDDEPVVEPEPGPSNIPANPYDPDKFVRENGFLTYRDEKVPCYIGIDVSSYQKEIDWKAVANAGVKFVIIRAGYRGYTVGNIQKDRYFEENIKGALAAGLDVGVYFFSQAVTVEEAREEAEQTLAWIKGYNITYPVVFDWEEVNQSNSRSNNVSGEVLVSCARAFCKVVEDAGYIPMTYGSPSKVYKDLDLSRLQDWPFWLANYTANWKPTQFRYNYHMWQYSSSGQVPGIEGRVDLDLCLTDFSEFRK